MINRYPDQALFTFNPVTTGEDDGLVGYSKTKQAKQYRLKGRLEVNGSTQLNYKAIFYAPNTHRLSTFENEQATCEVKGRTFNVQRIIQNQTHTQIWLS